MKTVKGFTITELVVAMAIVAILAAIAVPTYQDHLRRVRRADAQADLMQLSQWLERRHTETLSYLDSEGKALVLPFSQSPSEGGTAYYLLGYDIDQPPGNNTFVLIAQPQGVQAEDKCGVMKLWSTGKKEANAEQCW